MGEESAKTFSLQSFIPVFGPVDLRPGAGEGGWMKVTPNAPKFQTVEGVGGAVLFTFTDTNLYKVEITLLQSSKVNDALAGIHDADVQSIRQGAGGILLPLLLKDFGGTTAFLSPRARIMGPPEFSRSNKNNDQTWTIMAADGELFLGGN